MEIHKAWKRVEYPFATLVPSLATAIGSSTDRRAALTELMGILINEGKKIPTVRIRQLHFAEGTPFETLVGLQEPIREQVLIRWSLKFSCRNLSRWRNTEQP